MSSGRKASTVPSPPPPQSMSSASDSNSMLVALGNLLATQLGGDQDRTMSCQAQQGVEKKTSCSMAGQCPTKATQRQVVY